jgi:hypothetical protein
MAVSGRIAGAGRGSPADHGLPMQVLSIDALEGVALCAGPDGEEHTVQNEVIEPLRPGNSVLVRDGIAVALFDA